MIVYVESNFVLEIALEQEQAIYAEQILAFAEAGKIELAFPSFALSEPFTTLYNRRVERRRQYDTFLKILQQIKRSEPLRQIALNVELLIGTLRETHKHDFEPLHVTVQRLLACGRQLETSLVGYQQALIYEKSLVLSPQDSIIYAMIIEDLKKRPPDEMKCFLSRDKRAFPDENVPLEETEIKDNVLSKSLIARELRTYECKYFVTLEKGLDFILAKQVK